MFSMFSGRGVRCVIQLSGLALLGVLACCNLWSEDDGDAFGRAFKSEITNVSFATLH